MVNVANIKLWGEYVGAVLWDEQRGCALFEFDKSFIAKGLDISPINMPITNARIFYFGNLSEDTFKGLPGLLADSLPDDYGRTLINKWLQFNNRSIANPIELLCYQGKRGMGALEFEPAENLFPSKVSHIEISTLIEEARNITSIKEGLNTNFNQGDITEGIEQVISVGTSAGGARAKAVIAYNSETGDVMSGQLDTPKGYEHWLLKLDGVDNDQLGKTKYYGVIEYIYYLMAKYAGIDMMESKLLRENSRAHFMTKRFDRIGSSDKLHIQTLCGLAHYDYKLLHAYSYEQLFEVMRKLRLPHNQAVQMYRRMVFNVMARNQDDHTKNTSFIMDRLGKWSLSPAYDITWAYKPNDSWTSKHQMSINNKWDDITKDDLTEFATKISIKNAKEIIEQTQYALSKWNILAKENSLPSEIADRLFGEFILYP